LTFKFVWRVSRTFGLWSPKHPSDVSGIEKWVLQNCVFSADFLSISVTFAVVFEFCIEIRGAPQNARFQSLKAPENSESELKTQGTGLNGHHTKLENNDTGILYEADVG
jgi:hypothetical protein